MFLYDRNSPTKLWIHLHGFATNVLGSKIEFARNYFRRTGAFSFYAMDMDYQDHTTTEVLDVLEALVVGFSKRYEEIVLCGSSHGAYVVANYVRFRDLGKVRRILLLAPSFRTLDLIVSKLGEERVKNWLEGKESLRLEEEGREIEVREYFGLDILRNGYEIIRGREVNFPKEPPVDVLLVHGTKDEIVPIEDSELFGERVRLSAFIKVDDDHQLSESFGKVLVRLVEEGKI